MHPRTLAAHSPRILLAALVLSLAGCAQIPSLGSLTSIKAPSLFTADASFAAPTTPWPDQPWWLAYGDEQLNALIEEALSDAPDLAAAGARLRQARPSVRQAVRHCCRT